MLTVGELKALFARVPDDTPIVMSGHFGEWLEIDSGACISKHGQRGYGGLEAPLAVVVPTVCVGEEPE